MLPIVQGQGSGRCHPRRQLQLQTASGASPALLWFTALFALSACGQEDATPNQDTVAVDGDGDGFTCGAGDCDDDDPAVHPGAPR